MQFKQSQRARMLILQWYTIKMWQARVSNYRKSKIILVNIKTWSKRFQRQVSEISWIPYIQPSVTLLQPSRHFVTFCWILSNRFKRTSTKLPSIWSDHVRQSVKYITCWRLFSEEYAATINVCSKFDEYA